VWYVHGRGGVCGCAHFFAPRKVNVMGQFYSLKHVIPSMLRRSEKDSSGSVILTSSIAGVKTGAFSIGLSSYAASKHAIKALALNTANEVKSLNIRVNVVAPGPTETPMTDMYREVMSKEVRTSVISLKNIPSFVAWPCI